MKRISKKDILIQRWDNGDELKPDNREVFTRDIQQLMNPGYLLSEDAKKRSDIQHAIRLVRANIPLNRAMNPKELNTIGTYLLENKRKGEVLSRDESFLLSQIEKNTIQESVLSADSTHKLSPQEIQEVIQTIRDVNNLKQDKMSSKDKSGKIRLPKPVPVDHLMGSTFQGDVMDNTQYMIHSNRVVLLDIGSNPEISSLVQMQQNSQLEEARIVNEQANLDKSNDRSNILSRRENSIQYYILELNKLKFRVVGLQSVLLQLKSALSEQSNESPSDSGDDDLLALYKIKTALAALNNDHQQSRDQRAPRTSQSEKDSVILSDFVHKTVLFMVELLGFYENLANQFGLGEEVTAIKRGFLLVSSVRANEYIELVLKCNMVINRLCQLIIRIKIIASAGYARQHDVLKKFSEVDAVLGAEIEKSQDLLVEYESYLLRARAAKEKPLYVSPITELYGAKNVIGGMRSERQNIQQRIADLESQIKNVGDSSGEMHVWLDEIKTLREQLVNAIPAEQDAVRLQDKMHRIRSNFKGGYGKRSREAEDYLAQSEKEDYHELNHMTNKISQGTYEEKVLKGLSKLREEMDDIKTQLAGARNNVMKDKESDATIHKLQLDLQRYEDRYQEMIYLSNLRPSVLKPAIQNLTVKLQRMQVDREELAQLLASLLGVLGRTESYKNLTGERLNSTKAEIAKRIQKLQAMPRYQDSDLTIGERNQLEMEIRDLEAAAVDFASEETEHNRASESATLLISQQFWNKIKLIESYLPTLEDLQKAHVAKVADYNNQIFYLLRASKNLLDQAQISDLGLGKDRVQMISEVDSIESQINGFNVTSIDRTLELDVMKVKKDKLLKELGETNFEDMVHSWNEKKDVLPPQLGSYLTDINELVARRKRDTDVYTSMMSKVSDSAAKMNFYAESLSGTQIDLKRAEGLSKQLAISHEMTQRAKDLIHNELEDVNGLHHATMRDMVKINQQLQSVKHEQEGTIKKIEHKISQLHNLQFAAERRLLDFDTDVKRQEDAMIADLRSRGEYRQEYDTNQTGSDYSVAHEKLAQQAQGTEKNVDWDDVISNFRESFKDERLRLEKQVEFYSSQVKAMRLEAMEFKEIELREVFTQEDVLKRILDMKTEKIDVMNVLKGEMDDFVDNLRKNKIEFIFKNVLDMADKQEVEFEEGKPMVYGVSMDIMRLYMYVFDLTMIESLLGKTLSNIQATSKAVSNCLSSSATLVEDHMVDFNDTGSVEKAMNMIRIVSEDHSNDLTSCLVNYVQGYIKSEMLSISCYADTLSTAYEQDKGAGLVENLINKAPYFEKVVYTLLEQAYEKNFDISDLLESANTSGSQLLSATKDNINIEVKNRFKDMIQSESIHFSSDFDLKLAVNGFIEGFNRKLNLPDGMMIVYKKGDVVIPLPTLLREQVQRVKEVYTKFTMEVNSFFISANRSIRQAITNFSGIISKMSKGLTSNDSESGIVVRGRVIVAASIIGGLVDKIRTFMSDQTFINVLKVFMDPSQRVREMMLRFSELYIDSFQETASQVFTNTLEKLDGTLFQKSSIYQNGVVQKAIEYVQNQLKTLEDIIQENSQRSTHLVQSIRKPIQQNGFDIATETRPIMDDQFRLTHRYKQPLTSLLNKHETMMRKKIKLSQDAIMTVPKPAEDRLDRYNGSFQFVKNTYV